ncbi:unnamed protein product [Larinioides sclopetarius]|uniref:Uncharacterized protein n=1 Tax=Larinioides sclopetarius TaxID=280406 RepID=A0AAV2BAB7_9ARAC
MHFAFYEVKKGVKKSTLFRFYIKKGWSRSFSPTWVSERVRQPRGTYKGHALRSSRVFPFFCQISIVEDGFGFVYFQNVFSIVII